MRMVSNRYDATQGALSPKYLKRVNQFDFAHEDKEPVWVVTERHAILR